jgi:hypothetical protein
MVMGSCCCAGCSARFELEEQADKPAASKKVTIVVLKRATDGFIFIIFPGIFPKIIRYFQ